MPGSDFERRLEAAQAGDEGSFTELFRSLQPSLLRYLRTVGGALADDVAAETWVSVVKGLGRARVPTVSVEGGRGADDRRRIEQLLLETGGSVSQAAERLGLSRQALYRRMEKLGISLERRPRS